ncbi:MAG: SDR family NAD(P)-dependent oxidoreductase [Gilvibacter sp.]
MSVTTYLITGGAGNIGSALAQALAKQDESIVVIVDNLATGDLAKIPQGENVIFINGDVNNYAQIAAVFDRFDFDYVFHYAAMVGVKRTLANPLGVLEDIEGIKHVLNLSNDNKVKRVFYSSSSEVYGEPFEIPQNEQTTPLNSRLPYAIVKNVGEAFFRSFEQEYGLDYTIFRFFNTYGPNQSEDFVVPKFMHAALNGDPIHVYGDGLQTRSFCFVDDNVATCIKAMNSEACRNEILNVGSDIEMTILDLAKTIIAITGSKSEIVHLPPLKEGDMTRRCPDTSKMMQVLGRDLISLDDGLNRLLAFYENRS